MINISLKGNERPKQPKSAWGEIPQRPQQFAENNRAGRQFDGQRQGPEHRTAWNKQHPPPNQSQHRGMPTGQYPPLSESPPTGRDVSPSRPPTLEGETPSKREDEQPDEWSLKRQKQHEEMHAAVERARKRREQEELEFQAKTKAAAMMKLKAIEDKTKPIDSTEETIQIKDDKQRSETVESDRRDHKGDSEKERLQQSEKGVDHLPSADQKMGQLRPEDFARRRTDSDSSDASRSSGSRQFYHQQQDKKY